MSEHDDLHKLRDENQRLRQQIDQLEQKLRQHETDKNLPANSRGAEAMDVAPINEADVTLRRLVQRIAMILQAEKIVIMFYDRELGELQGIPPSYGVEEDKLKLFRVRANHGVSGLVFREAEPLIFHDLNDPRTKDDPFGIMHVQNGVTVPLVIEKRDEENRVIERNTIGVLHAFNKRHGEDFNDEDVRLLERMARNVGSIIANLQLYREVIEEREELLQTFESLSAGLMLVSPEGRLLQINASARSIFNLSADAIGKQVQEVIKNEDLHKVLELTAAGETEGQKGEMLILRGGSERIYEVQSAEVRNEEGKSIGVVAIMSDVTDIRNIDKMKSSFVAMASHELRTPLTAIKGFVRTLLDGEEYYGAEERHEFHTIIDQECDRLRRLIDDLLNTARIEAGESLKPNYTEFDLLPLLEKSVMIQRQASNKHNVQLVVENELPARIVGDEDKLDQILTNLLNNAIKYSPNGGDVTVKAKAEGNFLLVGVSDQGLGIPKEHLTKVFEKFHRVNNEDNRKIYGTGLGLYLVHHLVEQVHMGKIWAESEVGVGSTFWFRIPTDLDIDKAKAENN
jgi:two-component system phosphate regulon sensor histidine kinase PhoR